MTPEQALALLDQVAASAAVSRQVHMQVVEAIKILHSLLPKKQAP